MPRKISPDLINARLAPPPDPAPAPGEFVYGELYGADPATAEGEEEGGGGLSNASFVALALCLSVIFGGAVYYLTGTPVEEKKQLAFWIDAQCGKGWEEGLPNDLHLRCYLTTDVSRLCQPREREHLVSVLERHASDTAAYERAMMSAALSAISEVSSRGAELGLASARAQAAQQNNDQEGFLRNLGEAVDIGQDIVKKPQDLMRKANERELPSRELETAIANLMAKGLLSAQDFGWFKPGLVKRAAEQVKTVTPVCG